MDSPSVKRRYLRRDISIPIKFEWNNESRTCLTTTLGEGGLYAQTLLPPPIGTHLKIELEFPNDRKIQVMGEVRHSLENTYGSLPAGFGVQFLDLGEQDKNEILTLVNSED